MDNDDFKPSVFFVFALCVFVISIFVGCSVEAWIEKRKHGNKQWNGNGIGQ
jgi:hypothetical protein